MWIYGSGEVRVLRERARCPHYQELLVNYEHFELLKIMKKLKWTAQPALENYEHYENYETLEFS